MYSGSFCGPEHAKMYIPNIEQTECAFGYFIRARTSRLPDACSLCAHGARNYAVWDTAIVSRYVFYFLGLLVLVCARLSVSVLRVVFFFWNCLFLAFLSFFILLTLNYCLLPGYVFLYFFNFSFFYCCTQFSFHFGHWFSVYLCPKWKLFLSICYWILFFPTPSPILTEQTSLYWIQRAWIFFLSTMPTRTIYFLFGARTLSLPNTTPTTIHPLPLLPFPIPMALYRKYLVWWQLIWHDLSQYCNAWCGGATSIHIVSDKREEGYNRDSVLWYNRQYMLTQAAVPSMSEFDLPLYRHSRYRTLQISSMAGSAEAVGRTPTGTNVLVPSIALTGAAHSTIPTQFPRHSTSSIYRRCTQEGLYRAVCAKEAEPAFTASWLHISLTFSSKGLHYIAADIKGL